MKDKELKLEDVKAPHTLGSASYILFEYIDPVEVGSDISLAEVELRKPRNLFVCVSDEREDGERGEREGDEDKETLSLSSGTHRIHNSLAEPPDRLSGVEFFIVYYESSKREILWQQMPLVSAAFSLAT